MDKFDKKEEITFNYINIYDFQLVRFALVEIKETFKDKYIGWVKKDFKDYLYNYLHVTTSSIILKYSIIKMGMPQRKIYKLTIAAFM